MTKEDGQKSTADTDMSRMQNIGAGGGVWSGKVTVTGNPTTAAD
jgi:hypothetical protein